MKAPHFTLPGTDDAVHSNRPDDSAAKVTVVYFTCNHCPYALAWEDRIHAVATDYAAQGVRLFAINANDADRYPADSFAQMKSRVAETPWPVPYLRDEDQIVAAAFGAKTTPDLFVFDADETLAYRGAPDSDYQDESQNAAWLREALDAILAGNKPYPAETKPVGCSVKWK